MAKMINFSIRKNNAGMFQLTADMSKKPILSSTGKSFKLAYVDEGYGGFIKLDDHGFPGMMLQFQLLKSARNATPEPEEDNTLVSRTKPEKKNNEKVVAAEPAKRGRGRPRKETVSEDIDDVQEAEDEPVKNNRASSRRGMAKPAKAKARK